MNQELAVLWRRRLDDWSVSLLPLGKWCQLHGVNYNQFYYWQRILTQSHAVNQASQSREWLTAQITEPVPVTATTGAVKVRAGGCTLEIEPGFDPAVLRAVVEALGARLC